MTRPVSSDDPFELQRFLEAQDPVYSRILAELTAGVKQSHWMWFVFPQIQGLGHSAIARHYAISSVAEARAYLQHPALGSRLRECTRIVNGLEGRSALQIFGFPDTLKFRSSMTLFAIAAAQGEKSSEFATALARYFQGAEDELTRKRLADLAHQDIAG